MGMYTLFLNFEVFFLFKHIFHFSLESSQNSPDRGQSQKSDLVKSGVRTKGDFVNSVFCSFSWEYRQNIPKIPV